jgi:hypothetical protein
MPTRFDTKSKYKYGSPPLRSGYENQVTGIPDLTIPSCGVEDVDVAIFNLFDKEIRPECGGIDGAALAKVPVVFAAGEKWALLKKGRPLRDRNNTLLLPLITIMRDSVQQDKSSDVTGRGINQQTGEFVIKRRLSKYDRSYQNVINKLLLKNQDNVPVGPNDGAYDGQPLSDGPIGDLVSDPDIGSASALLKPASVGKNIYETIVVPVPQFYTVSYKVTVWTQYMQHSNQIIEKLITSYLPQGQSWRIDTPKGYWFIATVDDGGYEFESNFDDMSQAERFIKHNFTVKVPAYFFATRTPGAPVPLKVYVSSPSVSFDTVTANDIFSQTQYAVGSDDPSLPLESQNSSEGDFLLAPGDPSLSSRNDLAQELAIDPVTGLRKSASFGGITRHGLPKTSPGAGGNGNRTGGNSPPRSWRRSTTYPVNSSQDPDDPANLSTQRGRNVTVTEHAQGERTYRGLPTDFEIVIGKL